VKGDDRHTGLAIGLHKYFQLESRPTVKPRYAASKIDSNRVTHSYG
jgi:hypothetical protein